MLQLLGYKTSVGPAFVLQNSDAVSIHTFIAIVAGNGFFSF